MNDVVVIGGGVVGLSIAYELAGQGVRVAVLESGQFGKEASWAGAGILPPGNLQFAQSAESKLRALSHSLWKNFSAELHESTGIDNGFENCGSIETVTSETGECIANSTKLWRNEGVEVQELDQQALQGFEPQLNPNLSAALRLPNTCQVRNPRHLKALLLACAARNVSLHSGQPVYQFNISDGKASSVETPNGAMAAGRFILAAGAWSSRLLSNAGVTVEIEPVRGQIVLLSSSKKLFNHIIEVGPRYLVPRPDGRILIGSTEEHVGFDKRNTAEAIAELIRFGTELVPELASATFERSWAGLRPSPARQLPFIGQAPGLENLFLATGHFRSGLQMSPGTALLVRQLLLDQEPAIELEPFSFTATRPSVVA